MTVTKDSRTTVTLHFAIPPSRLGDDGPAERYLDPEVGPHWPLEPFEVPLIDLRPDLDAGVSAMEQLEKRGFAVCRNKSEKVGGLANSEEWNADYLTETAAYMKELLGAREVLVWNSVTRSGDPSKNTAYGNNHLQKKAIAGLQFGATIRPTASGAHVDQDGPNSRRMCKLAAGDDIFEKASRVQQINLWRPLKGPVTSAPLAVVDGSTVKPSERSIHNGRFGTRVIVHHGEEQKWGYIKRQQADEVILIKIFDSKVEEGEAMFAPHAGVDNIYGQDGPEEARESIEVRVVAVYD